MSLLCSCIREFPEDGHVEAETCRKHMLACRCILGDNHLTEQIEEGQLTLLLHVTYALCLCCENERGQNNWHIQRDALLTNERSNNHCYNPENNRI